ncbi:MAG: glycosyltransferase family 39 protein [archaeon]
MKKKKIRKTGSRKDQKKEKEAGNDKKVQDHIEKNIFNLSNTDLLAIILIIGLFGYIYLSNINAYDSLMYDEAGYITMGRTLAVEHYHGIDVQGTKESYRQPLFPLMIASSFLIFGISYTAAKIPVIISALMAMIVIYMLVQKIYDRKIAFFSAAMLGAIPLTLQYVENILSDIPSVLFYTLTMLSFYIGIEKKNKKYLYIAWLSFGLTFLIRYNAVLIIASVAAYLAIKIITGQTKLKDLTDNKDFMLSPIAALIPLAPYFIYQQLTFGDAFIGIKQARGALDMTWGAGPWHTYITQAPQYLTWLGFILTILGIAWTLYKKDRFGIYMLTWAIIPLAYFSAQILKDLRLIDTIAAPLTIFAALGAYNIIAKLITRDLKLSGNITQLAVPAIMLIYIMYAGYTDVLPRFQQVHALGYPSLQLAGEWIQKNTEKDAILMTASEPGHQWYSYRKTVGYPEEERLVDTINEKGVDYIIIDNYERMQPPYIIELFTSRFTENGMLKYPQDAQQIMQFQKAPYQASTLIIPAGLFLKRMNEQQPTSQIETPQTQ